MAFETYEASSQDGSVVSLYEFRWGETVWRYTSADQDIVDEVIPGEPEPVTFFAIPISDDGMTQGGSSNNDLTVRVKSNIPVTNLFLGTPPAGSIELIVRRKHMTDPDDDWFIYWIGTVANVKNGLAVNVVIGRTLLATFKRSGARLAWTRNCPHLLYDSECRVDRDDFATVATITAVGSGTITVDTAGGHGAGYFDGGYFEWEATDEGTRDQRGIQASLTSTQFKLFGGTDRLEIGMEVTLYPGCDLLAATCDTKFDNLVNHGGLEQMTSENPFDGRNIF